jgi:glycosyltransferase involved in cell wall biosynthesis
MVKNNRKMNIPALDTKNGDGIAPLISVAMPVYNGEKYLAEAIDSILAQTFFDFELIIIDDGSTDNSLNLLREYQKKDARIRLVAQENKNLATTLNDIVDIARGKWIARMDQDDISLPMRFERQLRLLAQTDADICGSWVKYFGAADKRMLKHPQTDDAIKAALLFGSPFAHPTVMMKTDLVRNLRYDKAWEKCEDYDLWERAARAGWKMVNVPEPLLLYRQHDAQISTSASSYQHLLTQKIRRRRWELVFDSLKLERTSIDEILKLREPSPKPDMDIVDSVFIELLQHVRGEAREVVFDHATRLYFRSAATCPDIVSRWNKLNRSIAGKAAIATIFKLWLLSVFRLEAGGKVFQRIKRIYLNFIG